MAQPTLDLTQNTGSTGNDGNRPANESGIQPQDCPLNTDAEPLANENYGKTCITPPSIGLLQVQPKPRSNSVNATKMVV